MKRILLITLLCLSFGAKTLAAEPFVIAVMDPLAKELACACIDGFAQRDYKALANYLQETGDPAFAKIELVFASSLPVALRKSSTKKVGMVIGKDSVVRAELQRAKIASTGIARLLNKTGDTVGFTGLVIVAADDPAKIVADLKNHRLLFGPPECEEKYDAAIKLFKKHGVPIPDKPETIDKCTEAGFAILENETDVPIAAVVSDYALALIEGCDLIEKGALRVIDKTESVPFIGIYVTESVDQKMAEKLFGYLLRTGGEPKLKQALETQGFMNYILRGKVGFISFPVEQAEGNSKN